MKRKTFLILLILFSLTALFSCVMPPLGAGGGENTGSEKGDNTDGNSENSICTVTFDSKGTAYIMPKEVEKGKYISAPYYPPVKPGYTFDGWFLGDRLWRFGEDRVEADMTLTAKFSPIEYRISYVLSGGVSTKELPSSYNIESESIELPELTNGEKIFIGWFTEGEKITEISGKLSKDLTLYASFADLIPEIIEESLPSELITYATVDQDIITVKLSTSDTQERALTLRVKVPEAWHFAKLSQGLKTSYITISEKDGERYAEFDMLSNSFDLKISCVGDKNDLHLESGFEKTLTNGHKIDTNYFPGFVRKAVTFTLDDGLIYDETLLNILKPAGIRGTFNICNTDRITKEAYLSLYEGYEIANHHILHTTAMREGFDYSGVNFSDSFLPAEEERDNSVIYKHSMKVDGEAVDGFYYVHYSLYGSTAGWHPLASDETYIKYLTLTEDKIESVFGEGSVVGFAYPHGSLNESVKERIKELGYLYARKTGNLKDSTGFALPSDRFAWTYNADHNCLLEVMEKFDKAADDGSLKMFAFGVHAKDFETYSKWEDLRTFADMYGNRADDFFYATNREIFEYEDAVKALVITDDSIRNPSGVDVFITVDQVKTLIPAGGEYMF